MCQSKSSRNFVPAVRIKRVKTLWRPVYSDPGAFSPDSAKSFVIQHVKEVAIDHGNGIFAATTNSYIADAGGRTPMTVEEFVTRNRRAFV